MAENTRLDHSRDQTAKTRRDDQAVDGLSDCAQPGPQRPASGTPASKANCNLPAVSIEADRAGTEAVAKELRQTVLLGLKSWVEPEAVIGALRTAHPSNPTRFETAFTTFQGGNLRQELRDRLNGNDYRTAIAILENREGEKKTADELEAALTPSRLSLKFSADEPQALKILSGIQPHRRSEFEANFPKRVGEGMDLRAELEARLGKGNGYRTAIAILENREGQKRTADELEAALKQTKWWGMRSAPDTVAVNNILTTMEPQARAKFESDFPKNEGDDLTLRGELFKYLGEGDGYKQAIALLGVKVEPQRQVETAADAAQVQAKAPTQASIKEWSDAFSQLNKALKISGIPNIDIREIDEKQFKAAYAKEVVRIGKQYGFTPATVKDIASGLYAIEAGGWGTSYTTANMPPQLLHPSREEERLNFRPSSSAVGYNQLLKATTAEIVQKKGDDIADRLKQLSAELPKNDPRARELAAKAHMITTISAMLGRETDKPSGMSRKEFTHAVQALNMDRDIGPLIQGQQLGNLLEWYTKRKEMHGNRNVPEVLQQTAVRLNTSATAFDHLPAKQRVEAVKTIINLSGHGQKDQPVATQLMNKLRSLAPGLGGKLELSSDEQRLLGNARRRAEAAPSKDPARLLLNKLAGLQLGKLTVERLAPAAIEMANLAGQSGADLLLKHPYEPTHKVFSRAGLGLNSIAKNKDGEKLLVEIYSTMRRNSRQTGNAEIREAFDKAHKR